MSNTWWTSDTHFGHKNIIKFCPQRLDYIPYVTHEDDIEAMNEGLVALWNETVAPHDQVIFLGDFAMGRVEETIQYAKRLNGTIDMFWGNHDRPHYCNFESRKSGWYDKHLDWVQKYADAGFHTQSLQATWNFDGQEVLLGHFPYTGDSDEFDRYPGYRPVDKGLPLIHGHIHDLWQVKDRMINVGIDAWGRLLHDDEVADLVRSVA